MRAVAGNSWGANKKALRTIYRSYTFSNRLWFNST